jgi:hypothetical protein
MARPKANDGVRFHAALRLEFLLDAYISADLDRALPTGWGNTDSWRRYNASLLARFSQQPELLSIPQSVFNTHPDLHRDLSRQILFAKLFAAAPDYFLAFTVHFRRAADTRSQAETVATIMLVEGDQLLRLPSGEKRLDKEIAAELKDRKDIGLVGLHDSVIGKARTLIANWYDIERKARIAQYAEDALPILAWLDEQRLSVEK